MIGCAVLTGLLALFAVKLIAHRRACAAGWGRPGGPPWARHHRHHRHHRGGPWAGGGRGFLWAALARLDLSPGQEKLVRAEVDRLKDRARVLRDEARSARADMAASVRGEEFDEESLAGMFVRQDDLLRDLRGDLAGALGRIHTALDPAQRERLADLLEQGPWSGRGRGGPYR